MMGKLILERVKKTLTFLLLVSLTVSLTATSVSAWSTTEKGQVLSEKGACAKSMEEKVPFEKGACTKSMMKERAKGKVTAKTVCDCCCKSADNDPHWYCPGDICDKITNRLCLSGTCNYRRVIPKIQN